LGLLIDKKEKPLGGKWSFDSENRNRYPKDKIPPKVTSPASDKYHYEATKYVNDFFSTNPGEVSEVPLYPYTRNSAKKWLHEFLNKRLKEFGTYEDAIVKGELILNHSVLTPMLNTGLLTPTEVINEAIVFSKKHEIPLNSLEGFIRQITGWREFIRAVYEIKGRKQRNTNFWKFKRKVPSSFYTGETGIVPVDEVISKVLKHGYCHHIERLMVLGSFMLLCEFDPDEVYKWFMELFIDAYDWVMVPNVYGMSQFADGGLMSTKPYICGSNYIMKMSNHEKGDWQIIWDGLYWRFIHTHRDVFAGNHRTSMAVNTYNKMNDSRKKDLKDAAEGFLNSL
jgi:deoxyribodipyrimidine photolyase-related protein